MLTWK